MNSPSDPAIGKIAMTAALRGPIRTLANGIGSLIRTEVWRHLFELRAVQRRRAPVVRRPCHLSTCPRGRRAEVHDASGRSPNESMAISLTALLPEHPASLNAQGCLRVHGPWAWYNRARALRVQSPLRMEDPSLLSCMAPATPRLGRSHSTESKRLERRSGPARSCIIQMHARRFV